MTGPAVAEPTGNASSSNGHTGAPGTGGRVRRRRGGRGEQQMVPDAEFRSYYGRQVIHTPTWKVPDVPAYLYLGGLAGSSAVMAAFADVAGQDLLRRATRLTALGGAMGSVVCLVHDLGRPTRFLNMLRVFKPTSPLSVGSWILAPFSGLATAAALSELTGRLPALGRLAGFGSAVLGPPLATYTAVLLADTAVPAWHEAYRDLPFAFAGSATASGGAMGIITTAPLQGGAARRMVILGSFLEITAVTRIERALGLAGEPYQIGRPGFLLKTSRVLTAAGAVGSVLGRRSWRASAVSGALVTSGAVCARFGIFLAGVASAKDPKYTVIPQRERLRAREAAASSSAQFQPANPKENSDGVDGVGRNQ